MLHVEHQPGAERLGGFINTFTGRRVWPLDPRPEEIDIEDIARALAFTNRWRGHIRFAFSVAQHSILVSRAVPPEHALAGLLHDAPEAYLGDLASPIKGHMPEYKAIEQRLAGVIAQRFGLATIEPPEVKAVDQRITGDEAPALFASVAGFRELPEPLGIRIEPWTAERAFQAFLWRYTVLTGASNIAEAIEVFRGAA